MYCRRPALRHYHYGSDGTLPPTKMLLRECLYLSGRPAAGKGSPRIGQPRVVAAITGGGGLFFADLVSTKILGRTMRDAVRNKE